MTGQSGSWQSGIREAAEGGLATALQPKDNELMKLLVAAETMDDAGASVLIHFSTRQEIADLIPVAPAILLL